MSFNRKIESSVKTLSFITPIPTYLIGCKLLAYFLHTRTWEEWHLDQWDDFAPNETLDNVNLWKKVLEIKDGNGTWNESDLRQLYLDTTFQANEVVKSIHSKIFSSQIV